MCKFIDMLKRVKLENLVSQLIFNLSRNEKITADYEKRVSESYNVFLERLGRMYPKLDQDDDSLLKAITNFAITHDEAYFECGMLVGFQLYKNMEQEYKKCENSEMQNILGKSKIRNAILKKDDDKQEPLLEKIFEMRKDDTIDDALKNDKSYQRTCTIMDRKVEKIDKIELTHEEWTIVDDALAACNQSNSEYGRIMYNQGFRDALILLKELSHLL